MRPRILASALVLAAATAATIAPAEAAEDGFKVIVHPSNTADGIGRAQLSRLFLKKTTRWPSGAVVLPVEPREERLRARFAERVHLRSSNAVKSYFNQLIFSGRGVPPLERADDEDLVAYVRQNAGAIGYVSAAAPTAGVKVLPLKE